MEYLLIDFENIVPEEITGINENQRVLIFVGEKQTKIKLDLVQSTQPLGEKVHWISINGTGKNAADFHVAFYIGKYSALDSSASFKILSKDTGFDPLIKHLKSIKVNCCRIEDIPQNKKPPRKTYETVTDVAEFLKTLNDKSKPKRVAKLKSFIKNITHKDDTIVEKIISDLVDEKQIEIQAQKITYPTTNVDDELPF